MAERDGDLNRILAAAVSAAAADLNLDGIPAQADGPVLYASIGQYTVVVRNRISPAEPGTRDQMLDTYGRMVVNSILRQSRETTQAG